MENKDAPVGPGDVVALVDGSFFLHRAFHLAASGDPAKNLRPTDGYPNGAIRKFCERLLGFLEVGFGDMRPSHLAIVFDHSRRSHRHDLYPGYKGDRPAPPPELTMLKPLFRQAVRAFGYACIELENYEADDLIATYATAAAERGAHVLMVASDKDLLQMVGPQILAFDFEYGIQGKPGYRPARLFDENAVAAAWDGTRPERLGDVLALMGDSTDSVPGVPGIGQKTAAKLIAEFGDLETLLSKASEVKQPARREALLANAETARLSRKLVELDRNAPMPVPLDSLLLGWPDPNVLFPFLNAMEFSWLRHKLGQLYQVDGHSYPADPELAARPGVPYQGPDGAAQPPAAPLPAAPSPAPVAPPAAPARVAPPPVRIVRPATTASPSAAVREPQHAETPKGPASLLYRDVLPSENGKPFNVDTADYAVLIYPASMRNIDAWMRFDFRPVDQRIKGGLGHEGWKVHVSVHPDDLPTAWDVVLPIAQEARIHGKAAGPTLSGRLGDPSERQAGKTLVLYAEASPDAARWTAILGKIETALASADVRPGPRVLGDRPISGSAYLQRRASRGHDGVYVSGPAAYNPFGWNDPFEAIALAGAARADAKDDALRCMDLVVPGWRLDETGMFWTSDDEEEALLTKRAMTVAGLDAFQEATAVWFEELDVPAVVSGWHHVMEIRRAAEIGGIVRSCLPEDSVRISVRPRASGEQPPEIRFRFEDASVLAAAVDALPAMFIAPGGPAARVEGDTLAIPYAGWIHRGPTLDLSQRARIRELIDPAPAPAPEAQAPSPRP